MKIHPNPAIEYNCKNAKVMIIELFGEIKSFWMIVISRLKIEVYEK